MTYRLPVSRAALAFVPLPEVGEHPAGYLRRLAEANRLQLSDFRGLVDIRTITAKSFPELWARLAHALGIEPALLDPLRWQSLDGNRQTVVSFLGHDVHESYLHIVKTKLCRQCLAAEGILRSVWALRHVTACSLHQTRLTEACPTCDTPIRLTRHHRAWTCSSCEGDYRHGPEVEADPDEVLVASHLTAKADPRAPSPPRDPDLPAGWTTTTLQEMLTTIEYLASVRRLSDNDRPAIRLRLKGRPILADQRYSSDDYRTSNAVALGVLRDWPRAYRAMLEDLLDRNLEPPPGAPLLRRFATIAGLFAIDAVKDHKGRAFPFVCDERMRFLTSRVGYRPRGRVPKRRTYSRPADATELLSASAAKELLLGRQNASLVPWIASGLLHSVETGPTGQAFRRSEINALCDALGELPSPPPGRRDLVPAATFLTSVARRSYPPAAFVTDLMDGTLQCYSMGPNVAHVVIEKRDLEHELSVWTMRSWVEDHRYADVAKFNLHAQRLWGPMGKYTTKECKQLVAAGELRAVRANFKTRRSDPHLYHVGDLIRHIQAVFDPQHVDVDALEAKAPSPTP